MKSFNIKHLAKQLAHDLGVPEKKVLKSIEKFAESRERVILIPDYSDKAAALFGNTKPAYEKLKELNEDKKKVASFNAKLAFGPGVIIPKKYLSDAKKSLTKNKIEFEEVERGVYENWRPEDGHGHMPGAKAKGKTKDSSDDSSDDSSEEVVLDMKALKKSVIAYAKKNPKASLKSLLVDMEKEFGAAVRKDEIKAQIKEFVGESGESESDTDYKGMKVDALKKELERRGLQKTGKKDDLIRRLEEADAGGSSKSTKSKSKKTEAPKAKSGATVKAKRNQWGNFEDQDTGVVFMQLPVGDSKGEDASVPVALGVQDQDADGEAEGLDTVNKFDKKMVKECEKNHFRVLTKELAAKLKKKDSKLYNQVKKFVV